MKFWLTRLLIIATLLLVNSLAFAGNGDLQITCEPGVRIFIDNEFKGVTNDSDGGLFISDLKPGRHTLKAVKTGYDPYTKEIIIREFKAIEEKIIFRDMGEKVKKLAPEGGETLSQVGNLELRSAPMGATVIIDGDKKSGTTDLGIENIRAGTHTIIFQRSGQTLSGTFNLEPGVTLKLKADFKLNKIVNISALESAESQRKAEAERLENLRKAEAERLENLKKAEAERLENLKKENEKAIMEIKNKYGNIYSKLGHVGLYGINGYDICKSSTILVNCNIIHYGEKVRDVSVDYYLVSGKIVEKYVLFNNADSLRCENGPCIMKDSLSFDYLDENGHIDNFTIEFYMKAPANTKMLDFNGRSHEITICLNGTCNSFSFYGVSFPPKTISLGRYNLIFSSTRWSSWGNTIELNIIRTDL